MGGWKEVAEFCAEFFPKLFRDNYLGFPHPPGFHDSPLVIAHRGDLADRDRHEFATYWRFHRRDIAGANGS